MVDSIPAKDLKTKSEDQINLIDVRTPVEFQSVHVRYARNIPLDQLDPETIKAERNGNEEPLYVICQKGSRGEKAREKLANAGLQNVINIEGGTEAAIETGLPVKRGRKAISLDRQVRITAGSLVVIGTVLGAVVSPYWLILSGFIGAGLVFAGITDTCGMAMMLAKMPWNQVKQQKQNSQSTAGAACST